MSLVSTRRGDRACTIKVNDGLCTVDVLRQVIMSNGMGVWIMLPSE